MYCDASCWQALLAFRRKNRLHVGLPKPFIINSAFWSKLAHFAPGCSYSVWDVLGMYAVTEAPQSPAGAAFGATIRLLGAITHNIKLWRATGGGVAFRVSEITSLRKARRLCFSALRDNQLTLGSYLSGCLRT
jgi:hypothetical protein